MPFYSQCRLYDYVYFVSLLEFCTAWPKGLETNEKCEEHFPLEVISSDYLMAGPSLRDSRANLVTFKVTRANKLSHYIAKNF